MSSILTFANSMTKICYMCKASPVAYPTSKRCRTCNADYMRNHYKKSASMRSAVKKRSEYRQSFINTIKDLPCQDCGVKFPPECMDFDHRDPELKSFQVSLSAVGSSSERMHRLMLEVSKCDLVCANCHRIRTKKFGHAQYRKSKAELRPSI